MYGNSKYQYPLIIMRALEFVNVLAQHDKKGFMFWAQLGNIALIFIWSWIYIIEILKRKRTSMMMQW